MDSGGVLKEIEQQWIRYETGGKGIERSILQEKTGKIREIE